VKDFTRIDGSIGWVVKNFTHKWDAKMFHVKHVRHKFAGKFFHPYAEPLFVGGPVG
jgi:hypothetical protein